MIKISEGVEITVGSVIVLTCLYIARTLKQNGVFCLTPCGPHACIVDTNQGSDASVRALRLLREELRAVHDPSRHNSIEDVEIAEDSLPGAELASHLEARVAMGLRDARFRTLCSIM